MYKDQGRLGGVLRHRARTREKRIGGGEGDLARLDDGGKGRGEGFLITRFCRERILSSIVDIMLHTSMDHNLFQVVVIWLHILKFLGCSFF